MKYMNQETAGGIHAWSGFKLQDLPAQQLCLPSFLLPDQLVSIVEEAQFDGEEAGVASHLAAQQLPATSCLLTSVRMPDREKGV